MGRAHRGERRGPIFPITEYAPGAGPRIHLLHYSRTMELCRERRCEHVKRELWLKTNRRAQWLLAILPASVVVGCLMFFLIIESTLERWILAGLLLPAIAWLALIVR